MERINWNDYFMNIAENIARRSPCLSLQIGAVITCDNKILSTGYNGVPKSVKHCTNCIKYSSHCFKAVHAEINAILQCNNVTINNESKLVLYTTLSPCIDCAKIILNTNIKTIYYKETYEDNRTNAINYLKTNGIGVIKL